MSNDCTYEIERNHAEATLHALFKPHLPGVVHITDRPAAKPDRKKVPI